MEVLDICPVKECTDKWRHDIVLAVKLLADLTQALCAGYPAVFQICVRRCMRLSSNKGCMQSSILLSKTYQSRAYAGTQFDEWLWETKG